MRTPSVYIAEELMPYLRARIASILYSSGLSQARIASNLGITQAMVSKYLAGKYKRPPAEIADLLNSLAEETARLILIGVPRGELIAFLSRRLFELFSTEEVCGHYSTYAGIPEGFCRLVVPLSLAPSAVLNELSLALRELLSLEGFSGLIPEVRSNFAYALPEAKGLEDVAAVPGRITLVKGRPYALPPEFGASRFTAGLVLEVMKVRPTLRSVLNIRFGKDVLEALKEAGLRFTRVSTGGLSRDESFKVIAGAFKESPWDAIVDEGGEGVEPGVYIFGISPLNVVGKVRKLLEVLR
jgi:predicted fused transcriptional regulator/phosphomethylpyrimidine kinase/predicted transcriptional regulator